MKPLVFKFKDSSSNAVHFVEAYNSKDAHDALIKKLNKPVTALPNTTIRELKSIWSGDIKLTLASNEIYDDNYNAKMKVLYRVRFWLSRVCTQDEIDWNNKKSVLYVTKMNDKVAERLIEEGKTVPNTGFIITEDTVAIENKLYMYPDYKSCVLSLEKFVHDNSLENEEVSEGITVQDVIDSCLCGM